MARRVIQVTIATDNPENRDNGKTYQLTEMSPIKAEKWAARALLAIGQSGVDVGDDVMTAGFSGLVVLGIRAILTLPFVEAEPLLDEMMECVQFVAPVKVRALVTDDIEEVSTILRLRDEVIELHTGFSIAAALSKLGAAAKAAEAAKASSDTSTSPKSLEP